MANHSEQKIIQGFLYPIFAYHGYDCPINYGKNAKLQEFSTKVNYIAALHSNGKLSSQEACHKLNQLWEMLESSTNH